MVILTAAVGAGHNGPACELAKRLTAVGHDVQVVDLIDIAPAGIGKLFRSVFHAQLCWAPGSWGKLFRTMQRSSGLPSIAGLLVATVSRRVAQILLGARADRPADVVVSTFPIAGHVVAAGRKYGTETASIVYITDPAVHRLWIAEGTDLYLTTWHGGAEQVRQYTAAQVEVVMPAVRPEFLPRAPHGSGDAVHPRRELRLPPGPLALLCSGSWGVGDVRRAAEDVLAHGGMTPIVLCGHNTGLRRRLDGIPGVVALGWVTDMAALMRICDVAVLNSGGLTLAECVASGLPVIHYRPLPGQGQANAEFCETSGHAPWPRTRQQLTAAMALVTNGSRPPLPEGDPIAKIVAAGPTRPRLWQTDAA
ncbi:MAG: hypothetical protein ACR2P2_00035 [Nakamurella sp.]